MKFYQKLLFCFVAFTLMVSSFPQQSSANNAFTHSFLPKTYTEYAETSTRRDSTILSHSFSREDLSLSQGKNGLLFSLPGCTYHTNENTPKLPRFDKIIYLKKNWRLASAETLQLKTTEYALPNVPIELVPPLLPYEPASRLRSVQQPVNDALSIQQFPNENFHIQTCYTADRPFIRVQLSPIYLRQGKWYFTNNIRIRLNYTFYSETELPNTRKKDALILTPDMLSEEAIQLKALQEKQGYQVSVIKLSSVSNMSLAERPKSKNYRGFSDFKPGTIPLLKNYDDANARKIISFLQQKLQKDEVDYVTILGDSKLVPPSYYIFTGYGQYADSWVPTDQFYASPFNKVDDFEMQIKIGRIPVRNRTEMQGYLKKLTRYHTNLHQDWFSQAAVLGGDPFDGEYMGELITSNAINQDRLKGFQIEKFYRTEDKFEASAVMNLLQKKDKGLIYHIGHGSGSILHLEPGEIDAEQCLKLPAKDKLPIMVSIACMNGAWDTQEFPELFQKTSTSDLPTSFSQALVLGDGGAIAYVGGARNNYGAVDFNDENGLIELDEEAGYMAYTLDSFCKNISQGTGSLGDASQKTLLSYLEAEWGYRYQAGGNTFFGFTLMGDPTLIVPALKESKTYSPPTLSYKETFKKNTDQYPLCPIDDGFRLNIASNSPEFNYTIAQYGVESKAKKDAGTLSNQSQRGLEAFFNPTWKSNLALRIETKDFKENRFVFWSKYTHDLVMNVDAYLSYLRPGDKQTLSFTLINDGIEDESKVSAFIEWGEQRKEYFIPEFPASSQQHLYLDVSHNDKELLEIKAGTSLIPNEKIREDNEAKLKLKSPSDRFYRIGYWSESSLLYGDKDPLELIDHLNHSMRLTQLPIEFIPIYDKFDASEQSYMHERLKPDLIVIDSPDAFDLNFSPYYRTLSNYLESGGKILALACLGKNSMGIDISPMHSLFGIPKELKLDVKSIEAENTSLKIDSSSQDKWSQAQYDLPLEKAFLLSDHTSFARLCPEGTTLAQCSDEKIMIIENDSLLFVNATIDWSKLNENNDLLKFVKDLVLYSDHKPSDPFIKRFSVKPAVGSKNQEASLEVYIDHYGARESDPLLLKVAGASLWEQAIAIPPLQPYETRLLNIKLPLLKLSGTKTIHASLYIAKEGQEEHEISSYAQTYTIQSMGEPDEAPKLNLEGEKSISTVDTTYVIKGKTHPEAQISVNEQETAVNSDGSFELLWSLLPGMNDIRIKASQGSLFSEEQLSIERMQNINISLPINQTQCLVNGAEKTLDEPAIIIKGSTFVPLRFIAESFKMEVEWIAKEEKIILRQRDLEIVLWIGKTKALINQKEVSLSSPPFIGKSKRTLLPLRFIAEGMKAEVVWDKDHQEVRIALGVSYEKKEELKQFSNPGPVENKLPRIINETLPEELSFPLCLDQWEDQIYTITNQNILIYNLDMELISSQALPASFWNTGSISEKTAYLNMANRSLMRINEKYLILLNGSQSVLVYDRASLELLHTIQNNELGLSLNNAYKWRVIYDMELTDGNLLYLVDLYSILVFDLNLMEIKAQLKPRFNIDLVVTKDRLYVSHLFEIGVYSLQGKALKTIEPENYIFPFTLADYGDSLLLANDPIDKVLVVLNEDGLIEKQISTSSKIGYAVERIVKHQQNIYFVSIYLSNKMPYSQSRLFKMDHKFKIMYESHKDLTKTIRTMSRLISNPLQIWTSADNIRYVNAYNPRNPLSMIRLDPANIEHEEIPIEIDYEDSSMFDQIIALGFSDLGQVGAMVVNVISLEHTLFIYDLEDEDSSSVKLQTDRELFLLPSFTFNEEYIIGYDLVSGDILSFDKESGKEVEAFSLLPEAKLMNIGQLMYRNDKLYVWDDVSRSLGYFSKDKSWHTLIDLSQQLNNFAQGVQSIDIDQEGVVFALDTVSGSVLRMRDQEIQLWGRKKEDYDLPLIISAGKDSLLVYDYSSRHLHEISKTAEEASMRKTPSISMFLENTDFSVYPNQKLEIPVSLQIFHTQEPIQTPTLPKHITLKNFSTEKRSQVFYLLVDGSMLESKSKDKIEFKCSSLGEQINLNFTPIKASLYGNIGSPYFHQPEGYFLSKTALSIDKGIIRMGEDALKFYGFDVFHSKDEIQLNYMGKVFILVPGSNQGWMIVNQSRMPLDVLQKVTRDSHQFTYPINTLFDLIMKPIQVQGTKIIFAE